MEFLDIEKKMPSFYGKIVKFFNDHGYTVGTDLFGAPYDWRFAADREGAQDDFFNNLVTLVEKAYHDNGDSKVALLSHSLGPCVLVEFLSTRDQGWKDKYLAV